LVTTSTTEAEYLACLDAAKEAQWLTYLHRDVTGETAVPQLYTDSQGALSTICSGVSSAKTKHIDIRFHNSHDLHCKGVVNFQRVTTDENLADLMTKALGPDKHRYFSNKIGLHTQ